MDLIRNNIVGGNGNRRIDRLRRLPPELLRDIHHHLFERDPGPYARANRFLPVARYLLHFQRENLYRIVKVHRPRQFFEFCRTMLESKSRGILGPMVNGIYLAEWGERGDSYLKSCTIGRGGRDKRRDTGWTMDELLKRVLPRLTRLTRLDIKGTSFAQSVFKVVATTPASLTLSSLALESEDYSIIDRILTLFPSLHHLDIVIQKPVFNEPTTNRIALCPPRQFTTLSIEADYQSQSIRNLIASTESTKTTLKGEDLHLALAALTNSEVMKELCIGGSGVNLEKQLSRFTNLMKLSLGGRTNVSDLFFRDYFEPELQLQSLSFTEGFTFNSFDLIRASETRPITLKSIVLDSRAVSEYFNRRTDGWGFSGFDKEGIEILIEQYAKEGVKVSGSAVKILLIMNGRRQADKGFDQWGQPLPPVQASPIAAPPARSTRNRIKTRRGDVSDGNSLLTPDVKLMLILASPFILFLFFRLGTSAIVLFIHCFFIN